MIYPPHILYFSRGQGYGHATQDVALVEELQKRHVDLRVQFISYAHGFEVLTRHGYQPIDLQLPPWPSFQEIQRRALPLLHSLQPSLVVAHEEFGLVPAAREAGVPLVFVLRWFLPASHPLMQNLIDAHEILFIEEPDVFPVPPYLRSRTTFVGPIIRSFQYTLADRLRARQELGIDPAARAILVLPSAVHTERRFPTADLILEAFDYLDLEGKTLLWLGGEDYPELRVRTQHRRDVLLERFDCRVERWMVASDLAILKGTNTSLRELEALGVPSVSLYGLNPNDDAYTERAWGTVPCPLAGLTSDRLAQLLHDLLASPRKLAALSEAGQASALPQVKQIAADRILFHLQKVGALEAEASAPGGRTFAQVPCVSGTGEEMTAYRQQRVAALYPLVGLRGSEPVTVIVPTDGTGLSRLWLPEALDSVLGQTYPWLEVLVVNSAARDTLDAVLAPYGNRIQYLHLPERTEAAALNAALERARGEYVWVFDAAHVAMPTKVECQVRALRENPDAALVHTGAFLFQETAANPTGFLPLPSVPSDRLLWEMVQRNLFLTPTVLVRRTCLEHVGGWDEGLRSRYHHDLWIRLLHHFRAHCLAIPTVLLRATSEGGTDGSIPGLFPMDQVAHDVRRMAQKVYRDILLEQLFPELQVEPVSPGLQVRARCQRAAFLASRGLLAEAEHDLEEALQFLGQDSAPWADPDLHALVEEIEGWAAAAGCEALLQRAQTFREQWPVAPAVSSAASSGNGGA